MYITLAEYPEYAAAAMDYSHGVAGYNYAGDGANAFVPVAYDAAIAAANAAALQSTSQGVDGADSHAGSSGQNDGGEEDGDADEVGANYANDHGNGDGAAPSGTSDA